MILVDTSVLIDYLRGSNAAHCDKFNSVIAMNIPYGITVHVYQELLQGCLTEKDFVSLKDYLDTVTFYSERGGRETYARAAFLYYQCRRKGITVRSSTDCLIVQIAIENGLKLLHNDRDFDHIAKVEKRLEFF
jgi:predicted nucleic acid-binding protein